MEGRGGGVEVLAMGKDLETEIRSGKDRRASYDTPIQSAQVE